MEWTQYELIDIFFGLLVLYSKLFIRPIMSFSCGVLQQMEKGEIPVKECLCELHL